MLARGLILLAVAVISAGAARAADVTAHDDGVFAAVRGAEDGTVTVDLRVATPFAIDRVAAIIRCSRIGRRAGRV